MPFFSLLVTPQATCGAQFETLDEGVHATSWKLTFSHFNFPLSAVNAKTHPFQLEKSGTEPRLFDLLYPNVNIIGYQFLSVRVEESGYFTREGADVHTNATISLSQAILGGIIRIQVGATLIFSLILMRARKVFHKAKSWSHFYFLLLICQHFNRIIS